MVEMIISSLLLIIPFGFAILLADYKYSQQQKEAKKQREFQQERETKEHRFKEYQQLFYKLGKMIDKIEKDVDKKSSYSLRMEMLDIYYRISLVNENKEVLKALATLINYLAEIIKNGVIFDKGNINIANYIHSIISAVGNELGSKFSKKDFEELVKSLLDVENTQEDTQAKPQYVWINTGVKHFPKAFEEMLKQNVACTYGAESYGNLLRRVKNTDIILLYHSGSGIIATGTVNELNNKNGKTASERKVDKPITIDDQSENEYQVAVKWDVPKNSKSGEIGPIVSASKIKDFGHRLFVPTVQYLDPKVGVKIVKDLEEQQKKLQ